MSEKIIRILKGDDMHCHLRRGKILWSVVGCTARQFERAVIMPNTDPPILTARDALEYRNQILSTANGKSLKPLMTIQVTDQTTPKMIADAKEAGVVAGKIYPQGVTTNSHNGVTNFKKLFPVFREMQKLGMLLLLHGEDPKPGVFCLDREESFFPTVCDIAESFTDLKIVLEHITTMLATNLVASYENIAATITAHHLLLTLDDVVGGLLQPHNFCKPIAKRPHDREYLLLSATSESPKFFFGSDTAPHQREKKECDHGCAGVFSALVALPLLAQIFEERRALDCLENFVSKFGTDFYGLPQSSKTIELVKRDWIVPDEYDGIVPFMAGQTLHWQVAE